MKDPVQSKRLIGFILLVLFLFILGQPLHEANANTDTKTDIQPSLTLEDDQLQDIRHFWNEIRNEYGGFLPESQKGSILEFIQSDKSFSFTDWGMGLLKYLFHEILTNGKLLGMLILLTVFSMLLQTMQNAFEQQAVSKVAYGIVYMVLVIIALNSFHVAASYTVEAIQNMNAFIIALIPLILALMASTGSLVSVAFFHPFIILLVNTSGLLIQHFVLPLLFLSALLSIVSTLTEHYKVTQLANLLRGIAIGVMLVFFTIFLGVISVQGATAAVADGVAIRTAKFITGNFIPIIGRMFTDATDTVMSASLLLKNTVGIAGVVILLLMCAFPALKVLSLALIYQIAAAVLQPLGGGPIIQCLNIISKNVLFIFAALSIVCFMFFLAVTMMIAAGNLTIMMR
ncbi:stage III sporulation protein AE [Alkalihalobacillus sp. AL-G]|uniref:stage III sporulation protein AE n=1 Tax=Alkalihalobacillus sp. AL-G TaxID=2926399 RepID=UPI002729BB25|nr:stage III sporulation protein AE [Alkalihalobacillus sp. AL-G]WLD91999.1 stage III sporulation protein AE [Alkalihalobacillus sp. AL-G]